ncbi:hypothetical protein M0R45_012949 [Rubus argutus]|uniref:non-specific serine/threonine protein kinase n=1 Tax=Rubus argutus TaxID=59490 RepID=A0AAW1XJS0_RUBAR
MSCFSCCKTDDDPPKFEVRKTTRRPYSNGAKALDSFFATFSIKSGSSKCRNLNNEILKVGKGNAKQSARLFTLNELDAATDGFNPACLLGEGGFGKVYKGDIESIKQVVAVKKLDRTGMQGSREFCAEIIMLSLVQHPNLVNLVGYCAEGDQRILVYDFLANGSLENHLLDLQPNQQPLDWYTRMRIAEGAAKGLEYLHDVANPPVIFRDFKASNILLDYKFTPKLSDFGLANFGVVFLELITGRRAIDETKPVDEQILVSWAQPLLKDRSKFSSMADPKLIADPTMADVVLALEHLSMPRNEQVVIDDESKHRHVQVMTNVQSVKRTSFKAELDL